MTERELFTAALHQPDDDARAAYLERACDDPAVRLRIQSMVLEHRDLGDFLESRPEGGEPPLEGPGSDVGPYRILERLGEGGMGTVFLAEQVAPVRRRVAIKVIRPGMDSRQVLARFGAERQALALMDHPNIARVLDAGATEQGRPYFVMELVEGVSITEFCDGRRLGLRERLGLFIPVCRAVQHAHQKGIIHRDLKPSNVLVALCDGRPVPKVIDFGVAKATGPKLIESTLTTGFGVLIGTPESMSPEQAGLSGSDVDTRSDVYSLGVLLYELIAGSPPIERGRLREATLLEVLRTVREEEPPRPSSRLSTAPGLPEIAGRRNAEPRTLVGQVRGDLDWIVQKALEKDRDRRYESAGALAADVQRYLDDEPVLAGPPSAAYRFRKFALRHRAPLAAGVLVAASLVAGTAVSTYQAIRAGRAERLAGLRLAAERSERERAVRAEQAGREQLFEALLMRARAGRHGRLPGQRLDGLGALAEAAGLARGLGLGEARLRELRDEAIACLGLFDVRLLRAVGTGGSAEESVRVAMDADLDRFARRDRLGEVRVASLVDGRELARLAGEARGATVQEFSPDGRLLALRLPGRPPGRPDDLQVWDWRRTRVVSRTGLDPQGEAVGFSPDGRLLAVGREDGSVRIFDPAGGAEVRRLDPGEPRTTHLAFRPDGAQLAVSSQRSGLVRVYDLATGRLAATLPHADLVMGLGWHPGNALLAAAGHDDRVHLWNLPEGTRRAVSGAHRHIVRLASFSPDGRLLLSQGSDGVRLTDLSTDRPLLALAGHLARFGRDGRRMACVVGDRIEVWGVGPPPEYRTVIASGPAGYPESRGQFSPDGRWLAAVAGGRVQLWDPESGEALASLPSAGASAVRFHPGGRELFVGGADGLDRWPIRREGGSLRVGPPRRWPGIADVGSIDVDRDGRLMACTDRRGAWLLDLSEPSAAPRHLEHPAAFHVAISPDGRWVASGAIGAKPAVRVWEARSGVLRDESARESSYATVEFSPDGRWLAAGIRHAGFSLREPGSWREVGRLVRPGHFMPSLAFSADARVIAMKSAADEVEILDPTAGRPLATVRSPYGDPLTWLALSPDGSRLVAGILGGTALGIWDLRRIREKLAGMGLDWDARPYPPAPEREAGPVRVAPDLGELAGDDGGGPGRPPPRP